MSDQQPPWQPVPPGGSAVPPSSGAAPPIVPPPSSHGAVAPNEPQHRPPPALASLAGAFAGLVLLASLFAFLTEVGGDNRRIGGVVLSLLFEAVGVVVILTNRNQRAATAGVALTAIGLIPLLVYLFVDVKNPGRTINSVHKFTTTSTIVLVIAALLWLAAYFVGPGRRYGFYLGAALVALWLVAIVQIIDQPLQSLFDPFASASSFTTLGPSADSGSSSSSGSVRCRFDPDTGRTKCTSSGSDSGSSFDSTFGPNSSSRTYGYQRPKDPSTKLGLASLLFGGAYLALAARRDRGDDARQATVLFAVSVPILTIGVLFMGNLLQVTGAALLAIAIGLVTAWLATRTSRRFCSWYATLAVVIAVFVLVFKAVGESARASGVVLAVIGVATVFAVRALEERSGTSGTSPDAGDPFATLTGSGPPAPFPSTATGPATGPAAGAPPQPWTPPSAPAGSPPTGPDAPSATDGPSFTPPPSTPWANPADRSGPPPPQAP